MVGSSAVDIEYGHQRSALLVGADAGVTAAAGLAADHADLRVVDTVPLADVAERLAGAGHIDVILVETAGADSLMVGSALAVIDLIARDRDIDVVVALAEDQVDLVAANLFGHNVQLLCGASVTERVAALRWAGGIRGHRLHDSARDADERLRRLNAEVARFAQTLSALAVERHPLRTAQIREPGHHFRAEHDDGPVTATDPNEVRDVIRARRMRAAFFPGDLFADPAWDMLLDLFAAELEDRRVSVSSLCIAAAVPGTTALRWIGSMVESGLFERYADAQDRRRAFISLSPKARDGMGRYFHAVRRARLDAA